MNKFNLQHFAAETNITKTTDLEPAISVDFTSRIATTLRALQEVLGITAMQPMAEGTQIKIYKYNKTNSPAQVAEGEKINLTKIERKLVATKELTVKKYRRAATAEAIQRSGKAVAINGCDSKLVNELQKDIKADFFTMLTGTTGVTTATAGATLQAACANAWASLNSKFEDEDVNPVYFINPVDLAGYLGNAEITMQTSFGLSYISNFLGLGTVIVSPKVTAGSIFATAKENLNGAYIPTSGALGEVFGLTTDETGMVGMVHTAETGTASIETLLLSSVLFYPERADGIVKAAITPAEAAKA